MSTQYPWAEAAGVSAETIKQFSETLPQGVSILSWLFENQKVDREKYFSWAQKQFQLVKIKTGFSIENKSTEFPSEFWNASLFPFYKWDNVLYVACLQPPSAKITEQIQEGLHLQIAYVLNPFCFEASAAVQESPVGLKSADIGGIDFSNLIPGDEKPTQIKPAEPPKPKVEEQPAPPKMEQIDFSSFTTQTNTGTVNTKIDTKIHEQPHSQVDTNTSNIELKPLPPKTQAPPKAAFLPDQNTGTLKKPMPPPPPMSSPVSASSIKPTPPPITKKADSVETISQQGKTSLLSSIEATCRTDYDKLMLLFFEDDKFKPMEWDAGWHQDRSMQPYIDLTRPSIFQIVTKSKGAFHGNISPNPVNDAFFAAFHRGKYPEFASIFPIMVKNKIIGMLMGTTSTSRGKKVKLEKYEDVCKMLASTLITTIKAA